MTPNNPSSFDLLTEVEAAALLRVKPDTLRQWRTGKRHAGKAPPYFQRGKGRVLYLRKDLERWLLGFRRCPTDQSESPHSRAGSGKPKPTTEAR